MSGSQEYRDRFRKATDSMMDLITRQRSRTGQQRNGEENREESSKAVPVTPIERRKLGPYEGKHLFTEVE